MSKKPAVFIGSSTEGLPVAKALADKLTSVATPNLWNKGVFDFGTGTVEALVQHSARCDYAVLVATADDMLERRGEMHHAPRDNVIFELGLFMGAIGQGRTALVSCGAPEQMHVPTDLAGITQALIPAFRRDQPPKKWTKEVRQQIAYVSTELSRCIVKQGRRTVCLESNLVGKYTYGVIGAKPGYQHNGSCEIRYEGDQLTIFGVRNYETDGNKRTRVQRPWRSRWMRVTSSSMTFEYDIALAAGGARGLCNFPLGRQMNIRTGEFFYLAPEKVHGSITLRRKAQRDHTRESTAGE